MRILITGGAGFIGSHTADLLRDQGHTVRIVDGLLPPVHHEQRLPEYLPGTQADFRRGDVRDKRLWQKALQDIDVVFHLAAYQDYLPDFSTFFHTNTVSTALLYEVAVERRLPLRKVIVASSQAVYGEGRYRCHQAECAASGAPCYPMARDEPALAGRDWEVHCPQCGGPMQPEWTDETVVNPHNSYAISKYTQELVALNLGRRYGIPTVAMRYSIVQGPRQSFRNAYSGVLRIFTQRLLNGRPPVCYEDGEQLRDYVSVFDVARANMLVMEDPRADFLALNVGGDRRISVRAYAELVARRLRVDLPPEIPGLYRVGDTRHIFSDTGRLKTLGWYPEVSLEEIVDGYVAWARLQPGFGDYSAEAEARMAALGAVRRVM